MFVWRENDAHSVKPLAVTKALFAQYCRYTDPQSYNMAAYVETVYEIQCPADRDGQGL